MIFENKIKSLFFVLLFLISCGVYRIPFTVNDQTYETKTFTFNCGEMIVNVYKVRSDYRIDLMLQPDPEISLYRDSLSVKYDEEDVDYILSGNKNSINSETELTLGVWLPSWSFAPTNNNSVKISFDGVFYCQYQKVKIDDIFIKR